MESHNTGCPVCKSKKIISGINDFLTLVPNLKHEWDYDKNNIEPNTIGHASKLIVWWKCPKGHSYSASIGNRVKGTNCPYCANKKILIGFNDLTTTNPELLKEWDYYKNGELTPQNVVAGSEKKVWWLCPNGHSYQAAISSRARAHTGCKYCANKNNIKNI